MRVRRRRAAVILGAVGLCAWCPALIWHPERVDEPGSVGTYSSLGLTSTNEPVIAYYDATNRDLKVTQRSGSTWQVGVVDSFGSVGRWCDLALDTSDRAHVSYFDATNGALKYARWTGSTWDIQTVHEDAGEIIGQHTSIAVDASDNPHISYLHRSLGRLYYARWTGSTWDTERVDSGNVGKFSSIAVEGDGTPHIAYYEYDANRLKYATRSGGLWSDTIVDGDGNVGRFASIALTGTGLPRISYHHFGNRDLKYATFDEGAWTTETVDSAGDVGRGTSLALDVATRPHIAYYDATNRDLKYARFDGSVWEIEVADSAGRVGEFPSMALDFNSLPFIGYANTRADDLKFATPTGGWFFFTSDTGYEDGLRPNAGTADSTRFKFRVIYQDPNGWGPTRPVVVIKRDGVRFKVIRLRVQPVDPFPNFALGAVLQFGTELPEGNYSYRFRARDQAGNFAGGLPTEFRNGPTVTGGASAVLASTLSAVPAAGGAQITLSLSAAATVDAQIVNIAGRPIRRLVADRDYAQGVNTLIWDGRDDAGKRAPGGVYMVVVAARTPKGDQTRSVCTVPISR